MNLSQLFASLSWWLVVGGLGSGAACSTPSEPTPVTIPHPDSSAQGDSPAFALVELFTSQGCSSCPPADALLEELMAEGRARGQQVVGLSFHVDYWNRLGWADPYSQASYTERQRTYSTRLRERTYTPQMIVNGQQALVGSRATEARAAVATALSRLPDNRILLQSDSSGQLHYTTTGPLDDLTLQVALVLPTVENDVPRGENQGRHLRHVQVVAQWRSLPAQPKGQLPLTAAESEQHQVVIWLQHEHSGAVTGLATY